METAVAQKTEAKKKSQPSIEVLPESPSSLENDLGSPAGIPLFLQRSPLQVSEPSDSSEQEADRTADLVMNHHQPAGGCQRAISIQRQISQPSSGMTVSSDIVPTGGQPLPISAQEHFSSAFGHDFQNVRVHTDEQASARARSVQARAFTAGQDIVFGRGEYNLSSACGQHLLAHELAHVVQQSGQVQRQIQRQTADEHISSHTSWGNLNEEALASQSIPWHKTENLRGNPPVRDKINPPNKDIVEDEAVYSQRRTAAESSLARQRERASSLLDEKGNVTDYRYWFAKVYSYVTDNELKFAASNAFYYPSYVMASVLYFEQIFQDNFNAFNEQGKVEDHWKKAFEEGIKQKELTESYYQMMIDSRDPDAVGGMAIAAMTQSVLGAANSLVAAMKAHIRFDLPRAEAWVFNSYYSQFPNAKLNNFQPDFMSMSGVFDNAAQEMNGDMAQRLGLPIDLVPQLMQDTTMRQFFDADMATERADTWQRAEELVNSNRAGTDPYKFDDGKLSGNATKSDNLSGLSNLQTEGLRPNMDNSLVSKSDTDLRNEISHMSDSDIAALPAMQKVQIIRRLLNGYTGSEDENTIIRIFESSKATGNLITVIDGADAWDLMYAIDGKQAKQMRQFFCANYYGKTAIHTALRLIRKCLGGETAEWEEEMVADILEVRGDGRSIVETLGEVYGGPAKGSDAKFKNGLYELEWQLDGKEEETIHSLFGSSNLS